MPSDLDLLRLGRQFFEDMGLLFVFAMTDVLGSASIEAVGAERKISGKELVFFFTRPMNKKL